MTDIATTVRRLVGRRHKITRQQMADIIVSLDIPADMHTITGRFADGTLYVGGKAVDVEDEPRAIASTWANMCCGIVTVSVLREPDGASMRYDDPGAMHPMQRAALLFAPASLRHYDYDQIGQLRRRAERVLIVSDDPELPMPTTRRERESAAKEAAAREARLTFLRRAVRGDGEWVSVLEDGALQMRDPNNNARRRFQFRLDGSGEPQRRLLPAEADRWLDSDDHEWAPYDIPSHIWHDDGNPIGRYFRALLE